MTSYYVLHTFSCELQKESFWCLFSIMFARPSIFWTNAASMSCMFGGALVSSTHKTYDQCIKFWYPERTEQEINVLKNSWIQTSTKGWVSDGPAVHLDFYSQKKWIVTVFVSRQMSLQQLVQDRKIVKILT